MKIRYDNVTEFAPHRFSMEASELEIEPGSQYPTTIETSIGNGMPFRFSRWEGDKAVYLQVWGCVELHVLND